MPTPIEVLMDPISLVILAMYAIIIAWERAFPAKVLPSIKWWKTRALTVFVFYFFCASYIPFLIDPWLAPYQLFDLSKIGVVNGAIVGIVVFEAGIYCWHRAMHSNTLLWRVFHQMHHSAERVDSFGTFYFSPMDTVGFALVGSISVTLVIGIAPQSVTIFLVFTTFLAMFQHANIRTPQWLGYFIQRPESHCVHHARKVHSKNFSDLPLFDILFGTFENPAKREHEAGFYDGASAKIWDMILFKDLSKLALGRKTKSGS